MEELKKKTTQEIIKQLAILDQKIELLILQYNKLNNEIIRRFPQVQNGEEFKPKILRR